jgi:hypothetical protein
MIMKKTSALRHVLEAGDVLREEYRLDYTVVQGRLKNMDIINDFNHATS